MAVGLTWLKLSSPRCIRFAPTDASLTWQRSNVNSPPTCLLATTPRPPSTGASLRATPASSSNTFIHQFHIDYLLGAHPRRGPVSLRAAFHVALHRVAVHAARVAGAAGSELDLVAAQSAVLDR